MLLLHQDRRQLQEVTQLTCQLFESLGLMVNMKKSILTPTQELEFLGFHLCSETMRLSIPSEKLRKIQQDPRHMLDQQSMSAWIIEHEELDRKRAWAAEAKRVMLEVMSHIICIFIKFSSRDNKILKELSLQFIVVFVSYHLLVVIVQSVC